MSRTTIPSHTEHTRHSASMSNNRFQHDGEWTLTQCEMPFIRVRTTSGPVTSVVLRQNRRFCGVNRSRRPKFAEPTPHSMMPLRRADARRPWHTSMPTVLTAVATVNVGRNYWPQPPISQYVSVWWCIVEYAAVLRPQPSQTWKSTTSLSSWRFDNLITLKSFFCLE